MKKIWVVAICSALILIGTTGAAVRLGLATESKVGKEKYRVYGWVIDEKDGTGIPNATVEVDKVEGSEIFPYLKVTTNKTGYYEFKIDPGCYMICAHAFPCYDYCDGREINVSKDDLSIVLKLRRRGHVHGQVFGQGLRSVKPLKGAKVILFKGRWDFLPPIVLVMAYKFGILKYVDIYITDGDGRFAVAWVCQSWEKGSYTLLVLKRGYKPAVETVYFPDYLPGNSSSECKLFILKPSLLWRILI